MTDRITVGSLLRITDEEAFVTIESEGSVIWLGWRHEVPEDEAFNTLTVREIRVYSANTLTIEVVRTLD